MCGRCEGEPYRGVRALFNGDLQSVMEFSDREDWEVISSKTIVFLGASALKNEDHPLFRGCDIATARLTDDERARLHVLGEKLLRPVFGTV